MKTSERALAKKPPSGRIRSIAVYAPYSKSIFLYGLYPILINRHYRLTFIAQTDNAEEDLARLRTSGADLLICASILRGVHELELPLVSLLKAARQYFERIYYFDDQDSCVVHSSPYIPFFDRWLKKQLFRDRSLYTREFLGGRFYSDYYCRNFGADPVLGKPIHPLAPEQLDSLRLAWSICIGVYPLSRAAALFSLSQNLPFGVTRALLYFHHHMSTLQLAMRALLVAITPRSRQPVCLARFDESKYSPSIGYQRLLYRRICREHPDLFAAEKVPRQLYQRELFWSQACLSPFGWGEVCYRDSEAIRAGAVLVKPSMQHIETWPDLYDSDHCVSVDWSGDDLVQAVRGIMPGSPLARRLRLRAYLSLIRANLQLSRRVRDVLEG